MFILNYIKSRTKRRQENKRIANDARTLKEIAISNRYSGHSLDQIIDRISYEEQKLTDMSLLSFKRKYQRILIAGMYRAKRRISARTHYEKVSTIANAPVVVIQSKKAA